MHVLKLFFIMSFGFLCITSANAFDTPTLTVDISFQTDIVLNEYIIHFRNKYWSKTRESYLRAVLNKSNFTKWKILSRHNPASRLPSDFDVLYIENRNVEDVELQTIKRHPAVKSVVPHYSVQRNLKYVPFRNSTYSFRKTKGIGRTLQRVLPRQITATLNANVLWKLGITGKGVKVAVFDTGLTKNHPHFRRVKERTNWTNEKCLDDGVSHGTFVAGIIASAKECLGFAPDAELHIYRVFTNTQVSYTSWFLDAFNYAIFRKINILNLSIGGPDFMDLPFVDKVLELSANKVIMVSAIGNDGPLYGTLNNPGDQSDVIGVGGISFDDKVAKFSSRGMTTWELPSGYGRLKPDIVTYGSQVEGSDVHAGCRSLSGTSVSSPVVAGAISLITSGALHKLDLINPSSMKQILMEGATLLPDNNMFEQGNGKLNILKSMKLLLTYEPKITLSPAYLDFTKNYMWPYSSQPLFYDGTTVIVNVTILNGITVTGKIIGQPKWYAYVDNHGSLLNVSITFSSLIWPWSGWMAVHLGVNENGRNFEGISSGHISLQIENLATERNKTYLSYIDFPIKVKIIPTPPRHKRILWDQYHSLRYPPGYIPRDNLKVKSDPLDWRADHIHTNFRDMYNHLRNSGYYIDVLRRPYSCFNASAYGTLLLVDPEEEFFNEEIDKLQHYVYDYGLSVIVFADWYNTTVMKKIKFFDENTRQWWIPDTGGANIPALNELLKPFGIALGDLVAEGYFKFGDHSMYYASGANIVNFPDSDDDILIGADLHDQGSMIIESVNSPDKETKLFVPILGLFQTSQKFREKYLRKDVDILEQNFEENNINQTDWKSDDLSKEKNPLINKRILLQNKGLPELQKSNADENHNQEVPVSIQEGRIAVFGDSSCLDSTHLEKACFWLLNALLDFAMNSHKSDLMKNLNRIFELKRIGNKPLPLRLASSNLHRYSKVLDANSKSKKLTIEKCDILEWTQSILVKSTVSLVTQTSKTEISSNKVNQNTILSELEMELNRVAANEMKYDTKNKSDTTRFPLFFIITLSIVMMILFILFLRRKRRLKHFIL